jgi:hypothetical protein
MIAVGLIAKAGAQVPIHTITAALGVHPNGKNSTFTVNLTMSPSDVNISGYEIMIAYDNSKVTFTGVTDNTGQPGAGQEYIWGNEQSFSGVPYANTSRSLLFSDLIDLVNPTNLGELDFVTTANFDDPHNSVSLYICGYPTPDSGGLVDSSFHYIPTAYAPLAPAAGVNDWIIY